VAEGSLADAIRASANLLPGANARIGASTVEDLLARAEEHRRNREFKQACELYATLVERGGMSADAWADYADAQASIAGRLAGAPARAIEAALALDPQHPKALWLEASLAHEERRYADALAVWRRLADVVPPDSSDASIVQANIAEATRLASS
jgi:cytochrome c-type biogenesis protein CcmH/NrfG